MTAIAIQAGFPQFADTDGTPLNNGKIYIGEVNKDPVANPIPVFFDQAKTIPAAQPLDTSNGYLYYQGSPSAFYTAGGYSIKVINGSGVTVYEAPEGIVTTVSSTLEEITQYLGAFDSAPATRGDGTALQVGDIFFDTTVNLMNVYDGSSFIGFAGPYLPLTGGTIAGDVKFNDDEELRFGDDNDLRIYHDGSNSFIKELGTGNLKISADANVEIGSSVTSQAQVIVKGVGLSGTDFYFGNSLKASIKSTGLVVDGIVEFDGLKGGTGVTITSIKDEDDMSSDSVLALATQQSIKAYVDNAVGPGETLAQTLALGNTTGGTNIDVTAGDHIDLPDDSELRFGNNDDLKIYHDEFHSYIRDSGTGNLIIQGTQLRLESQAGESYIQATANGGVRLYNNDVERLTTNSSGISVNGKIQYNSLEGQTGVSVQRTLDEDDMQSNSVTSLATQQSIKSYVDAQVGASDSLAEVLSVSPVTGGTSIEVSAADNVLFTDTSAAKFGDGADLTVKHDGTSASLTNTTGDILLTTKDNFSLKGKDGAEKLIEATSDGSVDLYYNNSKTLNTKDGGVKVTGDIEADTFTVGTFNPTSIATTSPNTMTVGGTTAPLTLISTNGGQAVGPILEMYRNSPSPADNDGIGLLTFSFQNGAGNKVSDGVKLFGKAKKITNASETTELYLTNKQLGANKEILSYRYSADVNGTPVNDRIIVNGNGQPVDFKVQSDTDGNALFVDGTTGFVGLGTSTPDVQLSVDGNMSAKGLDITAATPVITLSDNSGTDNQGRIASFYSSSGGGSGGLSYRSQGFTNNFGSHTFSRYDGSEQKTALQLSSNGSQQFYLDDGSVIHKMNAATGNVTIGQSANTGSRLYVNGEARSENLAVDTHVRIGSGGSAGTFAADLEFRRALSHNAIFTASCSGTALTVTEMSTGTISVGDLLFGSNALIPSNVFLVAQVSGTTGQDGVYTISQPVDFSLTNTIVSGSPTDNRIRFTSTDGFVHQGQPMGAIDFVSSDSQSPGTKAFIVAGHQEQNPSTFLAFGTNDSEDGAEAKEVARFDENGRLLVNALSTNQDLDHIELRETGEIRGSEIVTAAGRIAGPGASTNEAPLLVNRTLTEGAMLVLQRGSVDQMEIYSSNSNKPIICEPSGNGIKLNPVQFKPATSADGDLDNVMDLGSSGSRFKDLYLSGGISFAEFADVPGLANAQNNTLDGYERGTWTAGLSNPDALTTPQGDNPFTSASTYTGQYTRIGRLVHVSINMASIQTTGVQSGSIRITGLPFPVLANSATRGHGTMQSNYFTGSEAANYFIQGIHNSTTAQVKFNRQNNSAASVNCNTLDTTAVGNPPRPGKTTIIFDLTYVTP